MYETNLLWCPHSFSIAAWLGAARRLTMPYVEGIRCHRIVLRRIPSTALPLASETAGSQTHGPLMEGSLRGVFTPAPEVVMQVVPPSYHPLCCSAHALFPTPPASPRTTQPCMLLRALRTPRLSTTSRSNVTNGNLRREPFMEAALYGGGPVRRRPSTEGPTNPWFQ